MAESATRLGAPGSSATTAATSRSRSLSVVVGPHRYDVVVDEHLLVSEVLALVEPDRELIALTMSGESVPLDETVELAHLSAGTMLLTAPVEVDVPAPRVRVRARDVEADPGLGAPAAGGGRPLQGSRTAVATAVSSPASTAPSPTGGSGARDVMPPLGTPGGSSSRRRLGYAATSDTSSGDVATGPFSIRPTGRVAGAAPAGRRRSRTSDRPRGGRPAAAGRPVATVLVATLLAGVAVAAEVVVPRADLLWTQAVSLVLVLVGVVLAQLAGGLRLLRLSAPLLGAVGGVGATLALADGPVVTVVGGSAGAALVALTGRSTHGSDRHVPRVWLAFAGGVGGLALVAIVVGMPLTVVAAVALAAVTLLARVVPDLVIDVDDDVLLDISRLSVTSWSPREARRPRRRGWRIDDRAVGAVVAAASVEQLATLVGLAAVSVGASGALLVPLLHAGAGLPWSTRLLLAAAAFALGLTARAYLRRRDRLLLRVAALAPAVALGVTVLVRLRDGGAVATSGGAVVVGLALCALALAVGRGYRSLWASRLADLVERLALVAVLPLALWSAGLVERSMGLFV